MKDFNVIKRNISEWIFMVLLRTRSHSFEESRTESVNHPQIVFTFVLIPNVEFHRTTGTGETLFSVFIKACSC